MVMAKYSRGTPITVDYTPASSYSAGDVIVIGNIPMVATADNPPNAQDSVRQGSLACGLAEYYIAADAAYADGTYVYWDTVKQQVTTDVSLTAYPFGWIVGGPTGLASDGGPTQAGSLALVLHFPLAALQPQAQASLAFPRNLIDGGDFTTNPWQRGTSFTGIANTLTYTADRWFAVGGASSSISITQTADTAVAGFGDDLKFQRASSNSNTAALNLGQVLESLDCIRTQGQTVTLSFWAKKGANYSGGALTVALNHSTTAGNDTAAHLVAASTNWQATPTIINATQALTTTMTRYEFTGVVPATATQLGLLLTWTPTGTAGTDDSISINGVQLEIGNGAAAFEHRDVEVELALAQRYFYQINEPASGVIVGSGMISTTNNETIYIPFPTQMRAAPTVTVSAGSFKFNIAGTATAVGGGFAAGSTHTPNAMSIVGTVNATVGQATLLQGGGGSGYIQASADF